MERVSSIMSVGAAALGLTIANPDTAPTEILDSGDWEVLDLSPARDGDDGEMVAVLPAPAAADAPVTPPPVRRRGTPSRSRMAMTRTATPKRAARPSNLKWIELERGYVQIVKVPTRAHFGLVFRKIKEDYAEQTLLHRQSWFKGKRPFPYSWYA